MYRRATGLSSGCDRVVASCHHSACPSPEPEASNPKPGTSTLLELRHKSATTIEGMLHLCGVNLGAGAASTTTGALHGFLSITSSATAWLDGCRYHHRVCIDHPAPGRQARPE